MKKLTLAGAFLYKWGSVLALAVLAVAGVMYLLGGVAFSISVPISGVLVALLVREII